MRLLPSSRSATTSSDQPDSARKRSASVRASGETAQCLDDGPVGGAREALVHAAAGQLGIDGAAIVQIPDRRDSFPVGPAHGVQPMAARKPAGVKHVLPAEPLGQYLGRAAVDARDEEPALAGVDQETPVEGGVGRTREHVAVPRTRVVGMEHLVTGARDEGEQHAREGERGRSHDGILLGARSCAPCATGFSGKREV